VNGDGVVNWRLRGPSILQIETWIGGWGDFLSHNFITHGIGGLQSGVLDNKQQCRYNLQ
jgi:hypothetical protein